MSAIDPLVGQSLRMAIEGSSSSVGRPPAWYERSSDIRFVDYSQDGDDTLLWLQAPRIGEAAEELYVQQELWDTRPDPNATAFDVFSRVVQEVAEENSESAWFDKALLNRFARLQRLFSGSLHGVQLSTEARPPRITAAVAETAAKLGASTPQSRQVRVTGQLDMIRHSTRSFGLRMDSGEEVHGVLTTPELLDSLKERFGRRVMVLGRAVYRPSGRLLRIDAAGVEPGEGVSELWAKAPPPQAKRPATVRVRPADVGKRGVAAFFGIWPGDESDAEMADAVRQIRA